MPPTSTIPIVRIENDTKTDDPFSLDLTFAARGTAIGELMNSTTDGCTSTNQSACAGCVTD